MAYQLTDCKKRLQRIQSLALASSVMTFPLSSEDGCHSFQEISPKVFRYFSFAFANMSGGRNLIQMSSTLPQMLEILQQKGHTVNGKYIKQEHDDDPEDSA